MSFGEITNHEQLGWQLRAVRLLEKLLKTAGRDDLPAITWTVGNAGAVLVGRCYGHRGVDRRTEWEAWRATLGAAAWPERTDGGRWRRTSMAWSTSWSSPTCSPRTRHRR